VRRAADANAPIRHHHNSAGEVVELKLVKRNGGKLQVRAAALFRRPQEDYTGVAPRGMQSQIGEPFIRRNQPAPLILNARPKLIVGQSLPALPDDSRHIVTPSGDEVGNLPREILVDLNVRNHRPLVRWRGTKSALFTASAANLRAALMSSSVSCGHASMICRGVSPSAMLATITLTGTRVPLMHGSP